MKIWQNWSATTNSVITLANNHVLDWGETGLKETIDTLKEAHIQFTGAGYTLEEAMEPTISSIRIQGDDKNHEKEKKVAVVAVGLPSAGVPMKWRAGTDKCGVYVEKEASPTIAKRIMNRFHESQILCWF